MKRALTIASLAWFLIWVVSAVLLLARAQATADGVHPSWLEPSAALPLTVDVVRVALILICWIGSIYVWASAGGHGVRHTLALITLVFFGMLVGPFYILITNRRTRIPAGAAVGSRS